MATETRTRCGPLRIAAVLLGLVFFLIGTGCTTVKDAAKGTARTVSESSRKVVDAITPGGSGLKKTVVLIGIEGRAEPGQAGFDTHFRQALSEHLRKECREALLDETVGAIVKSPPRLASGQIDGFSLAMVGRPRGVNFFVIGSLTDARFLDEKTGFWLWKKTRYRLRVALRLEIVDSASGTKAFDESLWEESIVDEMRYEELKEAGGIPLSEMAPVTGRLLQEAGLKTCEVLRSQPWRGFVTAVDRNRLTLSAGSGVGLTPGSVLEVFDKGRVVENKDGQRFLSPGEKIGEARVESVAADRAEAVLDQAAPAAAGGTVRLR
ncbi:MAG: hypothetical protein MUC33_02745 [Desulfobacterales bacterium]|jgi:hypothetical protein|nr:hypothetical protein [Desulfobacterales bacterium]